jgi:hypothetical protein
METMNMDIGKERKRITITPKREPVPQREPMPEREPIRQPAQPNRAPARPPGSRQTLRCATPRQSRPESVADPGSHACRRCRCVLRASAMSSCTASWRADYRWSAPSCGRPFSEVPIPPGRVSTRPNTLPRGARAALCSTPYPQDSEEEAEGRIPAFSGSWASGKWLG